METDNSYGMRRVRRTRVDTVLVKKNVLGTVTATIVREDDMCLALSMTQDEANALAEKLVNASVLAPPPIERSRKLVHTINGAADVVYLGDGRYRVADAAVVRRHPTGKYWTIEGKEDRYPRQLAAITKVMEYA